MPIDYLNLFGLVLVAVVAPLLVDLLRVPVPDAVAMILIGIAVGSSGLGWVQVDGGVELLAALGLAYLLFVAGLEVRIDMLRGPALTTGLWAFGLSAVIAISLSSALYAAGLIVNVGIIVATLLTTSLGIVVVVLKDAGILGTPLGQLTLLGGLLGDFASVALISVIAPADGASIGSTLIGLAVFCVTGVALTLALLRLSAVDALRRALAQRVGGATQLGVRLAVMAMVGFAALGQIVGLEAILGSFVAGVAVSAISDRGQGTGATRMKVEVIGFGLLVPIFFVTAGVTFDLAALASSAADLVLVPILLIAMIATRALPTLLFGRMLTKAEVLASGLLLSTKLTFVVAVVQVASAAGQIKPATASALITAALITVVTLPPAAAWMLSRRPDPDRPEVVPG
ncbi:MAG TPA: cation:proton antiporter [Pseudonocardiaceae bacterium]|nr:cation:proton antiporter [Pseudonocardiaceae bacterium]